MRNQWVILLSKIGLFLNLVKIFKNFEDSKSVFIFTLASVVVEVFAVV
jgi:hypothetical protein